MKIPLRAASMAAALCFLVPADARPVVIENLTSFASPDAAYVSDGSHTRFADQVAIDGDYALATGTRRVEEPDDGTEPFNLRTAFLFRRSGSTWSLVRKLAEYREDPNVPIPVAVAMQNGVAVAQAVRADFYELGAAGWARTASIGNGNGPGASLAIDGGRVLVGEGQCSWGGRIYAKNSTGVWSTEATLGGLPRGSGCDDEFVGGPVDISGNWAVVHQPNVEDRDFPSTLIYRLSGGEWSAYAEARPEEDVTTFGPAVAIRGTDVIIGGSDVTGSLVYRETPFFGFHLAARIRPLDSFMGAGRSGGFAKSAEFLLQWSLSADREAGVVNVFRQSADKSYEHVATLAARNGQSLGGSIAISGRRVLVGNGYTGIVHYFELPASLVAPSVVQDTFTTGNAPGWTRAAGTFTTVQSGASRVLRQASVAADARAVLDSADWTTQAIEADIRPTQFGTAGAGFGLATRWQGSQNFYEARVRSAGGVELRRMASGTSRTLATAAFSPSANRTYRVRLQSVGTQHRVYIDGALLIDVDSSGPTHGRAALVTDRTAADFDNVVVSPSPHTTIYSTGFEGGTAGPWTFTGQGFWNLYPAESTVYFQSSVAGDARASIGVPADDQIVRVRARLDTFATASSGQQRWFGVMARHVDADNFYYLSLRNDNTASLRKLVNGTITVLGSAPLPVTTGAWYALRLDAVGSSLRGYVNGTLLIEATDASLPVGTAGPVMYKAAVDYDDFSAIQP